MDMITIITEMSKGNPGAAIALAELTKAGHAESVGKLYRIGMRGTDIYVLFSDICDKSPLRAAMLIEECPAVLLLDACSRQDRSGRAMVTQYLR